MPYICTPYVNDRPVIRFPHGRLSVSVARVSPYPPVACATVATAKALGEAVAEKLGIDCPTVTVIRREG